MARKKQPLKVIPEKEMFLFLINMEIIEKLKYLNSLQPVPSLKSELLHIYFLLPFFGVLAEYLFSLSIYIYIIVTTKKSPLSILRHLRVVNSEFLKQRFDGCLFQVSFYLYNFFSLFTIYYIKVYTYYTLQFLLYTLQFLLYIYTYLE